MAAVLGVIVFIGVIILLVYLRRKANKVLTQQVFDRGGHARGKAATREVTTFHSNASAEQAIDMVVQLVEPAPELPGAFVAKLVLLKREPGVAVFGYGNRVVMTFRAALLVTDSQGGGSDAVYQVLNWRTRNGIVQGLFEMERLANLVRTTASRLGATYALSEADAPTDQHLDASPAPTCPNCNSTDLGSRFCTDCGADLTAASGAAEV
ncbi:MAG: zinc ribbon domain-containing protein [Galbitalea sp.]